MSNQLYSRAKRAKAIRREAFKRYTRYRRILTQKELLDIVKRAREGYMGDVAGIPSYWAELMLDLARAADALRLALARERTYGSQYRKR